MLRQTLSPNLGREEQKRTLLTQTGGNGNGGRIPDGIAILESDDDEPQGIAQAAEAFLIRQRINRLFIVTDHCNETNPRTPLHEQHGHATLAIFGEGGAM